MQTTTRIRSRRRGIGNVIATIVFIFLLIFMTGNLMVWSILQFSDYQNVVQEMNELDSLRLNERIEISGARLTPSNTLDVTVTNTGGSTAHIVSLWIINETATPKSHTHLTQNIYIDRGQSVSNIGSSVTLDPAKRYTLRVITELGNTASYQMIPLSEATLSVTTVVDPPTVISEHDVHVSLSVYNNLSITGAVYRLQPQTPLNYTLLNGTATAACGGVSPTIIDTLPAGSTAVFDWTCTIDGNAGSAIRFNSTYVDAPSNVWDTDITLIVTGGGRANTTAYGAIAGSVLMDYYSIRWVVRSPRQQVSGWSAGDWIQDWLLDEDDYLVLRVNVTNKGDDPITLSNQTALYFQRLAGPATYTPFYIVNGNVTNIWMYNDDVILLPDQETTLFFAVDSPAADPVSPGNSVQIGNDGTFNVILSMFAIEPPRYGQSIPFWAFVVKD